MKKLVLTLALALSGAAGAHGVWVAQHYGEYGIVYGMGAYDDAYAGKKVRAVNGLDENLKPTPVQTRGHMQHTFVEPQKAAVVTVVFDNDLWRKTPEGKWKELKAGENAPADEVSRSLKYNISILKPYQGKLQPFADLPVQIIPDQDPSQLKQGEAFTVTVYNQGRPAANAEVTADYVNDMPNRVKTNAQGRATLHVRNAGVNVVGAMLSANMPQDKVATLHRVVSTLSFTSSKK